MVQRQERVVGLIEAEIAALINVPSETRNPALHDVSGRLGRVPVKYNNLEKSSELYVRLSPFLSKSSGPCA
jgi:hypothetical protein